MQLCNHIDFERFALLNLKYYLFKHFYSLKIVTGHESIGSEEWNPFVFLLKDVFSSSSLRKNMSEAPFYLCFPDWDTFYTSA